MTKEREEQLSEMSDDWLRALIEERTREIGELRGELERRHPSGRTKLVDVPCTLQELETAVHAYGDHRGFHGTVGVVYEGLVDPAASDYLAVTEGRDGQ